MSDRRDKVNYFTELSAGWSACNFLRACRDTNAKLVILAEIRACGIKRGCKIQIISLFTWKFYRVSCWWSGLPKQIWSRTYKSFAQSLQTWLNKCQWLTQDAMCFTQVHFCRTFIGFKTGLSMFSNSNNGSDLTWKVSRKIKPHLSKLKSRPYLSRMQLSWLPLPQFLQGEWDKNESSSLKADRLLTTLMLRTLL